MKFKQITIAAIPDGPHDQGYQLVLALGEDGTVYWFEPKSGNGFNHGDGVWLPFSSTTGQISKEATP